MSDDEEHYAPLYRTLIKMFDKFGWQIGEMHVRGMDYPVWLEVFEVELSLRPGEMIDITYPCTERYQRHKNEVQIATRIAYTVIEFIAEGLE